jgi:RNA polymerase sigma-70 factor (ECF subfamily)
MPGVGVLPPATSVPAPEPAAGGPPEHPAAGEPPEQPGVGRDELRDRVAGAVRDASGRVLALLARRYGDVDLAEDAVQDALLQAWRTWPRDGLPANPTGWLLVAARRAALDRLRHEASQQRRAHTAAADPTVAGGDAARDSGADGVWTAVDAAPDSRLLDASAVIPDERLRLVLLCCHPALDRDAQVALTLRLVLGLTTAEIAAAFLLPEATLAQRLVRAKRKIKAAGLPLSIPDDLTERVDAVLTIVYLVFTEGHFSAAGHDLLRVDLTSEALRLAAVLGEQLPGRGDILGLRALLTYHHARRDARVDGAGVLVLLEEQDRSLWRIDEVEAGNRLLALAMRAGPPTRYGLLAVVAGLHANAADAADTDWTQICTVYDALVELDPSPVVALNRAVAIAMRDGPEAGIGTLDAITGLDSYHAYHVARGQLLRSVGRQAEATAAFRTALSLAVNEAQRRYLTGLLGPHAQSR